MRRSRWLLVLSVVVVSSVLAWACGGGGGEKPGAATAPAATSPAGKTPEAAPTPSAQGGGGVFGDLSNKFGQATFKATYTITSTDTDQGFSGTMTWYKKDDNLRIDVSGEAQGEQTTGVFITRPDKSYFCTETPGMGQAGSCFEAPSGTTGGASDMVNELESTLTDPSIEVVSTSSRKIAGQDATCYTVRAPDIEGEAEMCLSNEGVPLFSDSTSQGVETSLEATDFSRDVSDSDFEPPYPVSEGMPGTP
jgi:hypothetical protein